MNIEQLAFVMHSVSSFKLALMALPFTHLLNKQHGLSADVMGAGPRMGFTGKRVHQ